MEKIFWAGWDSLIRTGVISVMAYVLLIFLLRSSGKRTLSKMNAFDFIVTVALGSTLATVMLNKSIPLADGVVAFFLLIYLQFAITWISARSRWFSNLVKSTPTLLVYRGELLSRSLRRERVSEEEIYAMIREKGFTSLEETEAVVLETDGSMTVLGKLDEASQVMRGVEGVKASS